MDGEKSKNPILKFLLLDVEFLGGAIIAIVIFAVLFGVLNYFNILSLSSIYKPLSFLPHQSTNLPTKSISIPSPKNYTTVPTPTPFQYDVAKAKTLLTNYIKDNIKPDFLPAKIEIKQGLSIDGRIEDIKNEFGYYLTTKDSTISANFHYKEGVNQQNDFEIFIQPVNPIQATVTASLANSLLTSYFTSPYSISSCQQKGTASYCENFQTLTDGKKGYGIVYTNQVIKSVSIIFNCFVPKESKNYDTQKSCISP